MCLCVCLSLPHKHRGYLKKHLTLKKWRFATCSLVSDLRKRLWKQMPLVNVGGLSKIWLTIRDKGYTHIYGYCITIFELFIYWVRLPQWACFGVALIRSEECPNLTQGRHASNKDEMTIGWIYMYNQFTITVATALNSGMIGFREGLWLAETSNSKQLWPLLQVQLLPMWVVAVLYKTMEWSTPGSFGLLTSDSATVHYPMSSATTHIRSRLW